jgi:hypothetical protein
VYLPPQEQKWKYYLIISGTNIVYRKYKNDLSDIAGILWEHKKNEKPITPEMVEKAVILLYGGWENIPENSKKLIDAAFADGDYEAMYIQNIESETQSRDILRDFDKAYPGKLKTENIDIILEQARRKKPTLTDNLNKYKEIAKNNDKSESKTKKHRDER